MSACSLTLGLGRCTWICLHTFQSYASQSHFPIQAVFLWQLPYNSCISIPASRFTRSLENMLELFQFHHTDNTQEMSKPLCCWRVKKTDSRSPNYSVWTQSRPKVCSLVNHSTPAGRKDRLSRVHKAQQMLLIEILAEEGAACVHSVLKGR